MCVSGTLPEVCAAATPQVIDKVLDHLKKKHKGLEKLLKPNHVKSHLRLFINCLIENPAFDSQVDVALASATCCMLLD